MKAADYIAVYLEKRHVTHVFELVGGMITFLLDSLHQKSSIKIVSMHHEQGAGFAAEGFGRMKGVPGIAMATSGPGATNLLTAIGSCYFDSVPTVFITGQVNRHEMKGDRGVRQLGFQETDIVSMAKPITKACWLVNDPEDLPAMLHKAFELAMTGRPGPVLIDVPMDVQRAEITNMVYLDAIITNDATAPQTPTIQDFIKRLIADLTKAERPLILAGGGINSGMAVQAFRSVVDSLGIPVVNSLLAVDVLPADHPCRVGLIGSYGNRWANTAIGESDFLLVLGSRLDVRQTGADPADFKGQRTIYHIDCDATEINNRVKNCVSLISELKPFLVALRDHLSSPLPIRTQWLEKITSLKEQWPDSKELGETTGINPNVFFHQLSHHSAPASAFVSDVGQHQMWSAQSLDLGKDQRFLTSGGMGAMGFALPTAIGACFASDKPVVVIAGDGGFQLNIQELQTVVRNNLPLKIVVINNHCHGMVRQFQESYFKGRLQSTVWGYSAPSFIAVAKAYGISSLLVETPKDVEAALVKLWENPSAPFLLEVIVDTAANAYPKLAFGKSISDMEPFVKPLDMEGT